MGSQRQRFLAGRWKAWVKGWGLCAVLSTISGCVDPVSIASIASTGISNLNGARESTIQTTIDDKTFTEDVRKAFLNAKHIGIVANDPTAIKVADLFEKRGGYIVKLDRVPAGEMTGAERHDALQKLCSSRPTDLALMGRITKTESDSNALKSAFTGRVTVKENWTVEMLACRSKTSLSFDGALDYDIGSNSQKTNAEYAEMIGSGIGSTILAALGK